MLPNPSNFGVEPGELERSDKSGKQLQETARITARYGTTTVNELGVRKCSSGWVSRSRLYAFTLCEFKKGLETRVRDDVFGSGVGKGIRG